AGCPAPAGNQPAPAHPIITLSAFAVDDGMPPILAVLPACEKILFGVGTGPILRGFADDMDARSCRAVHRRISAKARIRLRAVYAGRSAGAASLDQAGRHPAHRGPHAYSWRDQIPNPIHLVACRALRRADRWSGIIARRALRPSGIQSG